MLVWIDVFITVRPVCWNGDYLVCLFTINYNSLPAAYPLTVYERSDVFAEIIKARIITSQQQSKFFGLEFNADGPHTGIWTLPGAEWARRFVPEEQF